jgi:hypothetical protein
MRHHNLFHALWLFSLLCCSGLSAQQRVGVNTLHPVRQLEVAGSGAQYLRVHSLTNLGTRAGIEFMRGAPESTARDWKIENAIGLLEIRTGNDDFATPGYPAMTLHADDRVSLGIGSPLAPLQVNDGEEASNTGAGHLILGPAGSTQMVLDGDEILVRNSSQPANLFLQPDGGNTWFGEGQVFMATGGGRVGIHPTSLEAGLNVSDSDMQVTLRNPDNGMNDWFIGASDGPWSIGDDQLVFSPGGASAAAVLRLRNTPENTGTVAPVSIVSSSTQSMRFDGNEIDTESPLYINHNSDENIYVNPIGGRVGIGTSSPDAKLHVKSSEWGLGLSRGLSTWWMAPANGSGNLNFYRITNLLAYVSYAGGGAWVAVSDQRLKTDIRPLEPVLEKIKRLGLYRYRFISQPDGPEDIGVIAQEAIQLFPEAVTGEPGHYGVAYDVLTTVAIRGLQEQQDQLTDLLRRADDALARK